LIFSCVLQHCRRICWTCIASYLWNIYSYLFTFVLS